jgi:CheY-like chemotaxis protein/anti-sigma regulatory factor (Ser/Thr protein kinase)
VDVLEEIGRLGCTLCHTKELGFELQMAPSVPTRAQGDRWRLRQILHNLLGNAVAHTTEGQVTVSAAGDEDGPADTPIALTVAVTDTGDGIPPEHQERIFEGFVRGPSPGEHEGAGLGLAICKQLVEAMHGTLQLDSSPGHGTKITARVCFAPARGGDAVEPSPVPPQAAAKRLLLAEDSPVNREMATLILAELGHDVVAACDGEEAVAAATREPFDLILMDVKMPRRDGIDATRAIREAEHDGDRAATPIVAMTGNAVEEARQEYLDAGFSDCLFKPFTAEQLAELIERHTG